MTESHDDTLDFLKRYWILITAMIFLMGTAFSIGGQFTQMQHDEVADHAAISTLNDTLVADHAASANSFASIQVQLAELTQEVQDIKANTGTK